MHWIRFRDRDGRAVYAHVGGDEAQPVEGTPFGAWNDFGAAVGLASIECLPPVQPSKVIALWKNFHALAAKLEIDGLGVLANRYG